MSRCRVSLFAVMVLSVCCVSGLALAATPAEKQYTEGAACLAKAQFEEAMKHYAAAAQAQPENEQYKKQYMLVRRVIQIRKNLAKQTDPVKWERTAIALRNFYLINKIHSEALKLDQQRWDKTPTEGAAVLLAETQLEMNMNEQTAKLLSNLNESKMPRTAALRSLALARLKNAEEAKKLGDGVAINAEKPDADVRFDLACTYALLGDHASAAAHLTASFQYTKPSLLPALKEYARQRADLASLLNDKAFAGVWDTKSVLTESSCSSGSDCGSCPSRGSCDSAGETKTDDKK